MSRLKNLFKRGNNSPTDSGPSDISGPMSVSHNVHVALNHQTGALEGLPEAWLKLVNKELTQGELNENPDAVLHAVQYFMFSQKQGPKNLPFKVLATKEIIEKESMEIENMGTACPCGECRGVHTRGDKELIEFLSEEITVEKKGTSKSRDVSNLDGFDVKHNGAEIVLSKKFNDEQIEITVNVNHSVDADINEGDLNTKADNPPQAEMKSKPHFEVRLIKGKQVTRFACSYIQDAGEPVEDAPNDIFTIDELAVYEGHHNEQTYAVAGDILDGYMYDLLMNLLEERGVSNEFAEKLSDLATKREHQLFIGLLENLQSFVQGK
uniref:EOG090X0APE n=1 Tax=Daphnia similis TaxID=35528 RepID=A0A4Y7LRV0_9CRUS|nr:EOG090X0APE [Daphnia similis]SVE71218.1 EOG090X0APE [Daphnia similis]SVE71850.1 EOG090X0APE [Daphnia similis]SVE72476.1 EOG090X0APE [Daphnia similis]